MIRLFAFSVVLVLFSACHTPKKTAEKTPAPKPEMLVKFENSPGLMELLERAKAEHKLVFMDVYATWCTPCKIMEQEVFTRKEVADVLKRDFLSYRVDGEKNTGPTIRLVYEIEAYPTLVFLDADGKVLIKSAGSISTTGFNQLAAEAVRISKK